MRIFLALPLLMVAACSVQNDEANDQVTLDFDQNAVANAAEDVGNLAEGAGAAAVNAAEDAGSAIGNEVGDIDVDLDVNRNENRNSN